MYPESDLRMVRFDSDYVMLPSCPVYPVLAHSCISFCPCYLSYVIELLASLTLYRDIQEVQPLAPSQLAPYRYMLHPGGTQPPRQEIVHEDEQEGI